MKTLILLFIFLSTALLAKSQDKQAEDYKKNYPRKSGMGKLNHSS